MEKSENKKTIAEVSLRDSLSDWQGIVYQMNKQDFKFWEESWNDEFED